MSVTISPPEASSPLLCLDLSPPQERAQIGFHTVIFECRYVIFSAADITTAAATFDGKAQQHVCSYILKCIG